MPLAAWLGDHIADFANEVGHRDVTTSGAFEVMGAEVGIGLNQPTLPNLEPEPEPTARPDLRRVGDLEVGMLSPPRTSRRTFRSDDCAATEVNGPDEANPNSTNGPRRHYSTVTLLARFRGWSTLQPLSTAT